MMHAVSLMLPLSSTLFFFLTTRPPPTSTLFPYTTLFRSLQLVVAAVGQVGQEAGGELGDLGAHARVQLAPQVGERAVQLVMEALARLERGNLTLALSPLGYAPLRLRQVILGAVQLAAGLDNRELRLA